MDNKKIEKWVEVPIKFWVSAKDQETFDKVVADLSRQCWHAMSSSEGYRVESEAARRNR